jgi:hypothetical protein
MARISAFLASFAVVLLALVAVSEAAQQCPQSAARPDAWVQVPHHNLDR